MLVCSQSRLFFDRLAPGGLAPRCTLASLAGWRWLFILEGFPAIVLGIVTYFYMTDWPRQALWLAHDERDWVVNELEAEVRAKKKIRSYTIIEAFCDLRILRLILAYFLALTGALEPLLDTDLREAPFGVF